MESNKKPPELPKDALDQIRAFLAAGFSGNATLNIQRGQVLGLRLESIHKVKSKS